MGFSIKTRVKVFKNKEREIFLNSYSRYHNFSKEAFDYYMVLFGMLFYKISLKKQNEEYRIILIHMIKDVISKNVGK
jgi:hypothetical protein